MSHRLMSAVAVALSLMATQAPASAAHIYECDMINVDQGRGWISPKVAVILPGDGTVKIVDAVTLHFTKDAVQGTILRDNASRLIVKWTVKGAKSDSGRSFANFDYRASIAKATGKIELTAVPREFDSGLRSAGTCNKRTN